MADDDDASNNNNNNNKTSPAASSPSSPPLRVSDLATVFSDLTPIPQEDDDNADSGLSGTSSSACCCRIDYSDDFRLAYDYLRAVLRANEHSERALQLTALCLEFNPANYTVWHFRRRLLLEDPEQQQRQQRQQANIQEEQQEEATSSNFLLLLQQLLPADLDLAARLGGTNPKNYQIWYHRRALLEELLKLMTMTMMNQQQQQEQNAAATALQDYCQKELEYIGTVLDEDGKNYHAWSHRQWVVQTLLCNCNHNSSSSDSAAGGNANAAAANAILEGELEYTQQLIQNDPRNNSAWNHRWFATHQLKAGRPSTSTGTTLLSLAEARVEADYALRCARLDPYNECPFRYLVAVLKEQRRSLLLSKNNTNNNDDDMASWLLLLNEYEQKTWDVQQVLVDHGKDADSSVPLISAILDMLEWKGDDGDDGDNKKVSLEKVCELSKGLAVQDAIRQKYWNWRREQAQEALSKLSTSSSSSS